ncbi:hypothetical protein OHT76_43290 [Streptomyces sp. NBC_00287]|uniref:hypothetical protein n=1 Tax=Streptomyces sp. NBC_00287 TaxID=2975702 RepID=UPI002E2A60D8|nr:hypothetical protein [Streptomyces sp. NBC_00287]
MNRSGIRRSRFRTGALAASVLVSVGALTACGGSGDGDSAADASASPSASVAAAVAVAAAAAAAKPLTVAELDKASLTASDLTGFEVDNPGAAGLLAQGPVSTGEEDCAAVDRVMWGVALGDPVAATQRWITSELDDAAIDSAQGVEELNAAFTVTETTLTLASYDSADAAKAALKSLHSGIAACDGDFDSEADGMPQDVDTVDTATAPEVGDEAVAFTATVSQGGGEPGPMRVVVFRHDGVLAQFSTVNAAATVSGDDWDFPTVLAETQAAKLG